MENIHSLVHNFLPAGEKVEPLSQQDKECFKEIRDILKKHNKLERFGVTLLHKHFDIADDEMLVENIDEENRTQIIKPMKKTVLASMKGEVLETCWSLHDGEVLMGCRRACVYVDGKHHPNVHVWTSNQQNFDIK